MFTFDNEKSVTFVIHKLGRLGRFESLCHTYFLISRYFRKTIVTLVHFNIITMKKILLFLIIFIFYNCQNHDREGSKNLEEIKNINEIVEAVIVQDSLNVFKNSLEVRMFCNELRRVIVEIPTVRKDGLILPPSPRNIYITTLLKSELNGKTFSSEDSSYILFQNSNLKKMKIDNKILHKLNATTFEKELIKIKNEKNYRFYEMSIPIFSLDKQKAYVQLGYHCGNLCGRGTSIYLRKLNGKWMIVQKWRTWIS